MTGWNGMLVWSRMVFIRPVKSRGLSGLGTMTEILEKSPFTICTNLTPHVVGDTVASR